MEAELFALFGVLVADGVHGEREAVGEWTSQRLGSGGEEVSNGSAVLEVRRWWIAAGGCG